VTVEGGREAPLEVFRVCRPLALRPHEKPRQTRPRFRGENLANALPQNRLGSSLKPGCEDLALTTAFTKA